MDFISSRSLEPDMQASMRANDVEAEVLVELETRADSGLSTNELFDTSWGNISLGIILAAGLYPVVIAAIYACVAPLLFLWSSVIRGDNVPSLLDTLLTYWVLLMYSCAAGLIGMVWASLVSVITLPFLYLFAWSLKLRGSVVIWGAFCGGLVGFLAVLPIMLSLMWFDDDVSSLWGAILVLLHGPAITTVMGQLGGAWGGRKAERDNRLHNSEVALAAVDTAGDPHGSKANENRAQLKPVPVTFQFRITHLLWISVWVSLLLSVIRLSGIPFEYILPLLVGWLAYQAATLWVGWLMLPPLWAWWRGRV